MNVSDRSPFLNVLTVSERFMTVSELFRSLKVTKGRKRSCNFQERLTVATLNGQERLGTFAPERSNVLEPIVENDHGTVTFTLQKQKKHCICTISKINLFLIRKTEENFFKVKNRVT
jgi:hypothetical protein